MHRHLSIRSTIASLKTRFASLLRLVVSMSLLAWLLSKIDPGEMVQTWKDLNWMILLPVILVIHLLCTAIRTLRLTIILKHLDLAVSPLWLWLSHLKSNFVITLLPGSLAGDLYRTMALARTSQQRLGSVSAIVVERICGIAAMGILSVIGLAYGTFRLRLDVLSPVAELALLTLGLAAIGALLVSRIERAALRSRLQRFGKLGDIIVQAWRQLARGIPTRFELVKLMSVSVLFQLGIVAWYYAIALAMGIDVSFPLLTIIIPLVELFLLLPVSVGGLGVRETAFSVLLVPFGLPMEQAISFALLSFTLLTTTRILSGLAFLPRCDAQVQRAYPRQQPVTTQRTG